MQRSRLSFVLSLFIFTFGCDDAPIGVSVDAGSDAATHDAGEADASITDSGRVDSGSAPVDAGFDGGTTDAGFDGGTTDAGFDGGTTDAGGSDICGCLQTSLCAERAGTACTILASMCGSGTVVTSCPRADALYECVGSGHSITYYYEYTGTSALLETSCTSGGASFVTTPPPAPVGAPCSCRRTASACVGVYGAACGSLACTDGTRTETECDTTDALPGQCVAVDGQRRVTFYGLSRASAERSCNTLSGDYYWVP